MHHGRKAQGTVYARQLGRDAQCTWRREETVGEGDMGPYTAGRALMPKRPTAASRPCTQNPTAGSSRQTPQALVGCSACLRGSTASSKAADEPSEMGGRSRAAAT